MLLQIVVALWTIENHWCCPRITVLWGCTPRGCHAVGGAGMCVPASLVSLTFRSCGQVLVLLVCWIVTEGSDPWGSGSARKVNGDIQVLLGASMWVFITQYFENAPSHHLNNLLHERWSFPLQLLVCPSNPPADMHIFFFPMSCSLGSEPGKEPRVSWWGVMLVTKASSSYRCSCPFSRLQTPSTGLCGGQGSQERGGL